MYFAVIVCYVFLLAEMDTPTKWQWLCPYFWDGWEQIDFIWAILH